MVSINGRDISSKSLTEPSTPPGRIKVVDESMDMRSLPSRLDDQSSTNVGHIDSMNDIRNNFIGINDIPPSRESFGQYRNGRTLDRSRSATPRSTSRRSITPRRYVDSRRVSAIYGEINKRRRRSSMVINNKGEPVYDPQYVGPITVDYLRFLCKVVVQERKVQLPQQDTILESPKANINSEYIESSKKRKFLGVDIKLEPNLPNDSIEANGEESKINLYDQSLQLPSDTDVLLKSPIQFPEKAHLEFDFEHKTSPTLADPFFEPQSPQLNDNRQAYEKEPKQKSFSYLEKILRTRKLKMMESKESENVVLEQDINYLPNTNNIDQFEKKDTETDISFVIRKEAASVDYDIDFTNYEETKTSNRISISNAKVNEVNEANERNISNGRESFENNTLIEETKSLDELVESGDSPDILTQGIITTGLNSQESPGIRNIPDEKQIRVDEPEIPTKEIDIDPVDYQTPVNDISDEIILNSDLVSNTNLNHSMITRLDNSDHPNEINILSGGSSPTGIIQEEYTLDHNDDENNPHFNNGFSDSSDRDIEHSVRPENEPKTKQHRMNIPGANIQNSSNSGNSFSFNSIKKLVKLIQMMNSHTQGLGKLTKKRSNFSQETYSYIQESSDLFLENIMSDLSAYSLHRTNGKSNQINIKDVLLLLNRINFAGHRQNSSTGIQDIMELAQHFLPLELLISLDNNLSQIQNGKKELKKTINMNSYKSDSDFTNSDDDLEYKA